ncbi:MAG: TonB family protein [Sphingobium sp.]|nr:TonB family protein [Sphingobium sp.]
MWRFVPCLLIGFLAATASFAQVQGPQPYLQESWFSAADNSPDANRFGVGGTVKVQLAIDTQGQISDCTITTSSGFDFLDRHVCQIVMRKARFTAAKDASGKAVPSKFDYAMSLQPTQQASWVSDGVVSAEFVIDAEGRPTDCVANIQGEVSDLMKTLLCNVFARMPAQIIAGLEGRPAKGPYQIGILMAFSRDKATNIRRVEVPAGWRRISLLTALKSTNANGKLVNCDVVEQRGSLAPLPQLCGASAAYQIRPKTDVSGRAIAGDLWESIQFSVKE